MKKNLIRIILLHTCICFFNINTSSATEKSIDKNLQQYQNKEWLSYKYADIDGDGIDDYVGIFKDVTMDSTRYQVRTISLIYILSSNNFEEYVCKNFFPPQKLVGDKHIDTELYTIRDIEATPIGFNIVIAQKEEDHKDYFRIINFEYSKKDKSFLAVGDGGTGIFGKKAKYINVKKFAKETISLANWDEWYSGFMLSDSTILKNKILFVNDEKDFFKAIDNNTTIIIKAKELDLSLSRVFKIAKQQKYIKVDSIPADMNITSSKMAWRIDGVNNLAIIGKLSNLYSTESSDFILWFNNCKNIHLSNISIFHNLDLDKIDDGCNLCISNSSEINISYSKFRGFGDTGVFLYNTNNTNINQSLFYKISDNAIFANRATNFKVIGSDFSENQQIVVRSIASTGELIGCSISNNIYCTLISLEFFFKYYKKKNEIKLRNCIEFNNIPIYPDGPCKLGFFSQYHDGSNCYDDKQDINSGNVILDNNW